MYLGTILFVGFIKTAKTKLGTCFLRRLRPTVVCYVNVLQCYIKVCHKSTSANRDRVVLYKSRYTTPGMQRACHFDFHHPDNGVFFQREISWTLPLHVTLWPCLSIVAGCAACLHANRLILRRCKEERYQVHSTDQVHHRSELERY